MEGPSIRSPIRVLVVVEALLSPVEAKSVATMEGLSIQNLIQGEEEVQGVRSTRDSLPRGPTTPLRSPTTLSHLWYYIFVLVLSL